MTNHNGSAGSMPTNEPVSNWEWMRERLALADRERAKREHLDGETAREDFEKWLGTQLTALEADFEQCETHNSRMRDLRKDFSQSR